MTLSDPIKKAAHAVGAHRISTRPSTKHVRVELDETGLPTRYYLPREDVRMDLLTPSDTTSHCPFKGDATYFSAPGVENAFWTYEEPIDGVQEIRGLLAPWPGRVNVTSTEGHRLR